MARVTIGWNAYLPGSVVGLHTVGDVVCRLPFCLLEKHQSDIGVSYEVTRSPPRRAWRVRGNRQPTRSVEWGMVYTDY